jgi:hypothetical protein
MIRTRFVALVGQLLRVNGQTHSGSADAGDTKIIKIQKRETARSISSYLRACSPHSVLNASIAHAVPVCNLGRETVRFIEVIVSASQRSAVEHNACGLPAFEGTNVDRVLTIVARIWHDLVLDPLRRLQMISAGVELRAMDKHVLDAIIGPDKTEARSFFQNFTVPCGI